MKEKSFIYFLVLLIPISGFLGLYYQSWLSPGSFYLAFVWIPLIESILPIDSNNYSEDQKKKQVQNKLFELVLFLNIPILYCLIVYFLFTIHSQSIPIIIWLALVLNVGICNGIMGINVAHELGHRKGVLNYTLAQILLIPALYMPFTLEHNYWHHKYVATDKDPSTAKINQSVYAFWIGSIIGVWKHSYALERRRLEHMNLNRWHWKNRWIRQIFIQLIYLIVCYLFAGWIGLLSVLCIAIVAILLLESINYIEHYGLKRIQLSDTMFERVNEKHSWNSDHILGRIFLFELTRHSHHHKQADVKYQNLDSLSQSPQLPFGYPASILMALIPAIWFKVMNPKIPPVH